MRSSVVAADAPALYICRDGAPNRPLRNEAAVARFCADRGFQVVRLEKLPVMDQVALFAGARRIVSPRMERGSPICCSAGRARRCWSCTWTVM